MLGQHKEKLFVLFLGFFLIGFLFFFPAGHAEDKGSAVKIPPPLEHIPDPYEKKPQTLPTEQLSILSSSGLQHDFVVEVAKTREQKRVGMMHRKSVPQNTGMLFLFDNEKMRSFWMKDTHVSLDLLFIRGDGVIVHVHEKAEPFSLAPIPSERPAKAVLEVGGGEAARLGLSVGDRVLYDGFGQ